MLKDNDSEMPECLTFPHRYYTEVIPITDKGNSQSDCSNLQVKLAFLSPLLLISPNLLIPSHLSVTRCRACLPPIMVESTNGRESISTLCFATLSRSPRTNPVTGSHFSSLLPSSFLLVICALASYAGNTISPKTGSRLWPQVVVAETLRHDRPLPIRSDSSLTKFCTNQPLWSFYNGEAIRYDLS